MCTMQMESYLSILDRLNHETTGRAGWLKLPISYTFDIVGFDGVKWWDVLKFLFLC